VLGDATSSVRSALSRPTVNVDLSANKTGVSGAVNFGPLQIKAEIDKNGKIKPNIGLRFKF